MTNYKILLPVFVFFVQLQNGFGQNDRLTDYNQNNWVQSVNTIGLGGKWSAYADFQLRRSNGFSDDMQWLIRPGITYKVSDQLSLLAGYALIKTFAYGDFPLAANGPYLEHRTFEQLQFKVTQKKWSFTHRFRIEQRWVERISKVNDELQSEYLFSHRFRYMFRTQHPIWSKNEQQLYAFVSDEIFVSAGKNVGVNLFDQNRLIASLGFKLNKHLALEAGYLNQQLVQGRRVNNQTIVQANEGALIGIVLNY